MATKVVVSTKIPGRKLREGSSPSILTMKKVRFVTKAVLVKKNVIEDAMDILSDALQNDPSYRLAWFANLKFNIYDNSKKGISQDTAGKIADIILNRFFKA